jgi:hypothetical protein
MLFRTSKFAASLVWHAYGKSFRQRDIILAAAVRLSGQLLHAPVQQSPAICAVELKLPRKIRWIAGRRESLGYVVRSKFRVSQSWQALAFSCDDCVGALLSTP